MSMKELKYITPAVQVITFNASSILCLSDPLGNTSNEGFDEEEFTW